VKSSVKFLPLLLCAYVNVKSRSNHAASNTVCKSNSHYARTSSIVKSV